MDYDACMDAGAAALLALDVGGALARFDEAIERRPESYPKQWMRGIALYFAGRYEEGAQQFEGDLDDNPEDVEEVVWKAMCDMRQHGAAAGQARMLPRPPKDARCPMDQIYSLFSGAANGADVLAAAAGDATAAAYGHLYIGLYLDCLAGHGHPAMLGLTKAARGHYAAAAAAPSDDFMGKLSVAMWKRCSAEPLPPPVGGCGAVPRAGFVGKCGGEYSSAMVGCWQLSAGHHGDAPAQAELFARLKANGEHGLTTLDMGDIYTGVEECAGEWIDATFAATGAPPPVEIHTKLVPDLDLLEAWTDAHTDAIVRRSLNRLGGMRHAGGQLNLVQLHWWQWHLGDHVAAYRGLCAHPLVKRCGVTNYDAVHLQELLDAGLPVASNQVQYSLLDRRAEQRLVGVCRAHGVRLLCYGVLAGGFLSDTWLGKADPLEGTPDGGLTTEALSSGLSNRSLVKYYLVIREFGGWGRFQELLAALRQVADRHGATVAAVAQAWVLAQPAVSGAILGLSGNPRHLQCARRAYDLAYELTPEDLAGIAAVSDRSPFRDAVYYAAERERDGPHGRIMRYNCGALHTEAHWEEAVRRAARLLALLRSGALPDGDAAWRAQHMIAEFEAFPPHGRDTSLVGEFRAFVPDVAA
eukprot:TRINITY_DN13333_c0_g2_i1.p1 TRINITY_DN13333_c0_g2~~TRINITY_DN13333_c0_g2_i1.p1  ORF type:complete len:638 (+),score=242.34 TRINITY_DN13333_c0_g2_i1:67-1980(+)